MMIRHQEDQLQGKREGTHPDQYVYLNDPWYASAEYKALMAQQRREMADIRAGKLDDGEPGCPSCESHDLIDISGDYPTGVFAPDGGQESRYEQGYRCNQCGAITDQAELDRIGGAH
jgi:hypothetical protein